MTSTVDAAALNLRAAIASEKSAIEQRRDAKLALMRALAQERGLELGQRITIKRYRPNYTIPYGPRDGVVSTYQLDEIDLSGAIGFRFFVVATVCHPKGMIGRRQVLLRDGEWEHKI